MISSKYTIREQNEAKILTVIIDKKEVSRAELSTLTGLNKASVSAITKKMIEEDFITETRIGDASNVGGRKPIMLTFNRQSALVIAFDLGYNYIEAMLAYIDGTIIDSTRKKRIDVTAKTVVAQIKEITDYFLTIQPETPHGIIGLTAAIHGQVYKNVIHFTPYYDLDKSNLWEELQALYDFPIYLENEANLAALGEYTFSSHYQNLVSISIHSGIGAGIVENGHLQVGHRGRAGEIGHSILYPHGLDCPCGNSGCLEQYASNKATYQEYAKEAGLDYVNSDILQQAFNEKNQQAITLLEKNAELLSIGINNIIMMYDPEMVVINSSLHRKIPEMVDFINTQIKNRFSKDVLIRNTYLEKSATLYGAFAISAQNFLNIKKLKLIKVGIEELEDRD
ncbi:MarR family transcriptional regulator [Enterococcus sp. JM4C]|uniref:ROK family transcriptional regulator n=1 Tax=Candidatus Enterococcus huntleyi TaxID=1857217 RepID=UPI00137B6572|nr:ROK family transcriptional regulator [Enterococcus sp. JM4C]KAF1297358.1 MarR family transcriptional regulator [Enterococcus sp. JM4C]